MKIKNREKGGRIARRLYLFRLYRLVNALLRRRADGMSGVAHERLPDGNSKVLIVTIAFNNDSVLRHQIAHMREFWRDEDREYLVADNSPSEERRAAIREVCAEYDVPYILLPRDLRINSVSGSYSHGAAAVWLYYNYIRERNPRYFGFVDHDLFPIRRFSIADKMNEGGGDFRYCYGVRQERGSAWYVWMGLLFMDMFVVKDFEMNMLPCKVDDGVYMDTGGSLWYTLFSKLGEEGCRFADRKVVPVFVDGKRHRDPVDYIDDCWMHTNNGSNWKNIEDKQDMVRIFWEKYQNTVPDEIYL